MNLSTIPASAPVVASRARTPMPTDLFWIEKGPLGFGSSKHELQLDFTVAATTGGYPAITVLRHGTFDSPAVAMSAERVYGHAQARQGIKVLKQSWASLTDADLAASKSTGMVKAGQLTSRSGEDFVVSLKSKNPRIQAYTDAVRSLAEVVRAYKPSIWRT